MSVGKLDKAIVGIIFRIRKSVEVILIAKKKQKMIAKTGNILISVNINSLYWLESEKKNDRTTAKRSIFHIYSLTEIFNCKAKLFLT